jgi:hypothetical protein
MSHACDFGPPFGIRGKVESDRISQLATPKTSFPILMIVNVGSPTTMCNGNAILEEFPNPFVTELNRESYECEGRPASAAMRQSSFDPSPINNDRGANNEIIGCL